VIRFLLDDEEITLGDDTAADLTVLDWLRVHKRRTGTKEGCGSGDCGACTVVVAELTGDSGTDSERGDVLSYKAINSCITFIGALHGKQLLTVESLADGDQLHPVQAAMVSEHGSQCGFCTPGFVMSLYALYQADDAPALVAGAGQVSSSTESGVLNSPTKDVSDWHADVRGVDLNDLSHRIDRTIGGNLCRCTGYRPIKHAAVVALLEKQRATTSQDTQWQVGQSSRRRQAITSNSREMFKHLLITTCPIQMRIFLLVVLISHWM